MELVCAIAEEVQKSESSQAVLLRAEEDRYDVGPLSRIPTHADEESASNPSSAKSSRN